jgi:hypothetical protein
MFFLFTGKISGVDYVCKTTLMIAEKKIIYVDRVLYHPSSKMEEKEKMIFSFREIDKTLFP